MIDRSQFVDLLVRKLGRLQKLGEPEIAALESLPFEPAAMDARRYLIRKDLDVARCALIVSGYAGSIKNVGPDRNAITAFHLPGDIVGAEYAVLGRPHDDAQTMSAISVCWITTANLINMFVAYPRIELALTKTALIDLSIAREWIANIGARDARARLAHLLCELVARRQYIGMSEADVLTVPFSQGQISEAVGLTSVHTNRMMRELTEAGAISKKGRGHVISDWRLLRKFAEFDPAYLNQRSND